MGNQITYRSGMLIFDDGKKMFFENKNLVIIQKNEGITTTTVYGFGKTKQEILYENASTSECLICMEYIGNQQWRTCHTCDIIMHQHCERMYNKDKGYTECPHCRGIGCIGSHFV